MADSVASYVMLRQFGGWKSTSASQQYIHDSKARGLQLVSHLNDCLNNCVGFESVSQSHDIERSVRTCKSVSSDKRVRANSVK